jgi:bifunctional non-homologous end joining protein LigD
LPRFIEPQLSELVAAPPRGAGWVHELKYDGFRMHLRIDGTRSAKRVQFLTRSGLDWTEKYPAVVSAAKKIKAASAYIDGEMCAVLPDGSTSFPELLAGGGELVFFAFDALHLDGEDLTALPLLERKARLRALLTKAPRAIRYAQEFTSDAHAFLEAACGIGAEGVISKRVDAPYTPGDRGLWQKAKCYKREEFVIVGYTDADKGRAGTSSLLLGYYQDDKLVYAGRGGGGMSERGSAELAKKLKPLIVDRMPLAAPPPKTSRFGTPLKMSAVHWVEPKLVAEIRYLAWTADGYLRHPTFLGLRSDKAAHDVRRDDSRKVIAAAEKKDTPQKSPRLSRRNIQRELHGADPPPKEALRRYWEHIGRRALNYLGGRPLTLVRHVGGTTFFHEGPLPALAPNVHTLSITKSDQTDGVRLWVDSVEGLLGLVDMDVVEVHPWQSTVADLEAADHVVIDLDPGEGVAWDFVCATALALRKTLRAQGLTPWVKTSGGKGLHVMIPLEPKKPWPAVRKWSKALVEEFAKSDARYITSNAPAARGGKLFLDYLRNGRGNTAVGALSPRARPGWPVSMPVTWTQVRAGVAANSFTLKTLLSQKG